MVRARSPFMLLAAGLALTMAALVGARAQGAAFRLKPEATPVLGFTASSLEAQRAIEQRILRYPSTDRLRADHRFLTQAPHVAGSARDRELAEWTAAEWRKAGLEDVEIVEHQVLLPYATDVRVEMTAPQPWRASLREEPIAGDKDTTVDVGLAYHAYSASGDVSGEVVYAGSGNPADYDWLASHGIDIKGRIALVRYSVPYSYRGFKALTAQQRGAAGIIIYSDPADDGYGKGKVYPDGPWGPASHIQRGGIVYDFMVPGDPLTPGWASVPGAKRIAAADAVSLPTIVSVPMSYKDARVILEALGGREAPREWKGGLPITYHVGPGPASVRVTVRNDDKVRPIWTVTGRIRGASEPDRWVVLGNHRDAWVYGGVDPSSGSASMMEVARTLGSLARDGLRPRRTIVFASWDAEEWTLTSSTEWGEQFERELRDKVVAYLNVDSSASGPNFTAASVPALNQFIAEAAAAVPDPNTRVPLTDAWKARGMRERGALPTGAGADLVNNRLGSGSDYTVFLNFIGAPIVDMAFDGPYGVYHSMYDNHQWISRIGDPGFKYHAAMTRLWGLMATRLANADLLPLDYRPYAARIDEFLDELERRGASTKIVTPEGVAPRLFQAARDANVKLAEAATAIAARGAAALDTQDRSALDAINRALMRAERGFLDMDGIPGRPWYRHQIYAPKATYAPELLPGLAEAMNARDAVRVTAQEGKLAAALERAAAALNGR
ncbi:MAG: M28 family peptidase [Acidimicrobiia bacterium]|nr:M28 family peptidase [Acidimicrobiia bacterium]